MTLSDSILQKFNVEKAVEMMKHGKTQKEIGEQFGVTAQRISDCFKYYGIKYVRRSFYVNDEYFDVIDTEGKAYALGFFVADGCVKHEQRKCGISYRMAFCNSVEDKEAIEFIHNEICPEAKIVYREYVNRKPQYILQWTSEYMAKILETKYLIKARKTYDKEFYIPEDTIPDNLWRHFIRGFFDGDGHISPQTLEFTFTAKPFMEQVLNWFKNFTYRIYEVEGKTTTYWKVIINLDEAKRAACYHFFYDDATIYLTRKKEVFNTEISYRITNRSIEIVEHRVE